MDRSLGEPLPHQLANPTRADPSVAEAFLLSDVCGISSRFQLLSPAEGYVPTRYSPVRRCPVPEGTFSRDLHVLSLPPAFVLSQDQTLRFIPENKSQKELNPRLKNIART